MPTSISCDSPVRADLARRAAAGDEHAWHQLVERYTDLLYRVARARGLDQTHSQDVVEMTWLRAAEQLHTLRDPAAVGAWLAALARREADAVIRYHKPVPLALDEPDPTPGTSGAGARQRVLRAALNRLPQQDRQLLGLLAASPAPTYAELAAALDLPISRIGSARSRSLNRLRQELERLGDGCGG